jgi:large subunit ribosomal protein L22
MVTAELKNYRQSPRKVRLVVDAVRGKDVNAALTALTFMPKKASLAVKKLLESAVANASHNFNLKSDNLIVKEITVDQGPIIKRWRARARGTAASIHKHTSHIKVVLAEKDNK